MTHFINKRNRARCCKNPCFRAFLLSILVSILVMMLLLSYFERIEPDKGRQPLLQSNLHIEQRSGDGYKQSDPIHITSDEDFTDANGVSGGNGQQCCRHQHSGGFHYPLQMKNSETIRFLHILASVKHGNFGIDNEKPLRS